jgi:hypothetical protein
MAEGVGFEIPKGSPESLRAAASAWKTLAHALEMHADRLGSAASMVVGADWRGDASLQYASKSRIVSFGISTAGRSCNDIASGCKTFAHALKDAQERAKAAKHRAEDAITRRDAAKKAIGEAEGRIAAANTAAENAAHHAGVAGAAGPAGATALARAQADGHAAARASEAAAEDLRRARDRLEDAERDLRRARRDGEDANDDAERAARAARETFTSASSYISPAPYVGQPVPVSLRGASPDAADLNGGFGGPFHAPGHFGSPGEARAAQVAKQRRADIAAAEAAAQAKKDQEGGVVDRFAGEFDGLTGFRPPFGIGNPKTKGYQGGKKLGNIAGYFPSPASLERLAVKVGIDQAKKEAKKEAKKRARKPMKPVGSLNNPTLSKPRLPEHPEVDLTPPPSGLPDRPPVKITVRRNPTTGKIEIQNKLDDVARQSDKRGKSIAETTRAIIGIQKKIDDFYFHPPAGPLG